VGNYLNQFKEISQQDFGL